MRWGDVITLISEKPPEDGRTTNKHGFDLELEEQSRVVFCNKKPHWQSEFYKAQQIGVEVKFNVTIRACDYDNEELVEYEGKRYKRLRAEESKNGEFVMLVLSDLSERADISERDGGNG